MDRIELRRKNFITEFPATIASGLTIDSGDYHASLDRLLEQLGLEELEAEQQARRDRGDVKQIGIGFSTYNEMCGLAPSRILGAIRYAAGGWESATDPLSSDRHVPGRHRHLAARAGARDGLVADRGRPARLRSVARSRCCTATRASRRYGLDTYGSRSLPVGGAALWSAGEKIIEKARQIVAHQLEVSADDLDYEAGTFTVKGSPDKEMTVKDAAWAAFAAHNLPDGMEPNLEATATYDPPNFSWPGGAHAAVVEVDTETGDARLIRYVAVDDVGTVVNPLIVDGQVHGGITQGVATALYEEALYDEDGNLANGDDGDVPRAVGRRAAVVRARPHREQGRRTSVRREGRGGDRDDRRGTGRDQRGRSTLSPISASPISRCLRLRRESGARSRRRSSDPRSVRLRGGRIRRARGRAARGRSRCEGAGGRALAHPGAEAAHRRVRPSSSTSVGSPTSPTCETPARSSRSGRSTRHAAVHA